jgi:hypothetical protein
MTFMESSSTETVSMYVAGQPSVGIPFLPTLAQAGLVTYSAFDSSPHRAGDYSGISVDPVDPTGSFWAVNEYAKDSGGVATWGTHIQQFTDPPRGGGRSAPDSSGKNGSGRGSGGGDETLHALGSVPVIWILADPPILTVDSTTGRSSDNAVLVNAARDTEALDAYWVLGQAERDLWQSS